MMKLHCAWPYIEQEFGCGLRDRFLMPVRSFDNPKAVSPFLVERDDGARFALFVHVEKGNAAAAMLPPAIKPVFYRPYFTFEPGERPPAVHADLVSALQNIAGGERQIQLDRALPVSVARDIGRVFSVTVEPGALPGPVTARSVRRETILAMLGRHRPAARGASLAFLEASPLRDRIKPYLDGADDNRFAVLDAAVAAQGIGALLLTSTLNMQEAAGVPMRVKRRPVAALYVPGSDPIVMETGVQPDGTVYGSAAELLRKLVPSGRIGIESEDLDLGHREAFDLEAREISGADGLLRKWRDTSTLPDLPFYIVTTRASAAAMRDALGFAEAQVRAGAHVTEMDAFAVYMKTLHATVAQHMPGFRVARTLTNFHAGARTIFPANPAPFPLTSAANTLKIDAGCLLFDDEGYLLGCSDIARTLAFSEPARELYDRFSRAVRETLIPRCATGATGADIHKAGVDAVWGDRKLAGNPLFVGLQDPSAEYARDVGHLLGRNNLSHLTFTSREAGQLPEAGIACCEYQWPVADHAVAYEDTCLVTLGGGLNLTSDDVRS